MTSLLDIISPWRQKLIFMNRIPEDIITTLPWGCRDSLFFSDSEKHILWPFEIALDDYELRLAGT